MISPPLLAVSGRFRDTPSSKLSWGLFTELALTVGVSVPSDPLLVHRSLLAKVTFVSAFPPYGLWWHCGVGRR